ncbi:endo-1,3-beta glucanase [Madurella fahalii]|uniref:glucan endo-1,3-beta-D-glucosidase n=1 Tax=Madurella fahalii TaxID=1157608 RepID=A0ABQ0GDI9_9PEZI
MDGIMMLVFVLLTIPQVLASLLQSVDEDGGRFTQSAGHFLSSPRLNTPGENVVVLFPRSDPATLASVDCAKTNTTSSTSSPSAPPAWSAPPPRENLTAIAKVITSSGPSGVVQILASEKTPCSGFIPSVLETLGRVTSWPILTSSIPTPTSLLSPASVLVSVPPLSLTISGKMAFQNIFADPISTDAPPANIARRQDHPVRRLGITASSPIPTNKFHANFFLGNQTSPTWLHPYSVAWARGQGATGSWGLAISHIEAGQRVFGEADPASGAARYFINPIGIHSVCLSAKELGSGTALTTESLTDFSGQVSLRPSAQASPAVQFPLVQGSGFITAVYNGAHPLIQTGIFFRTVTRATGEVKPGITKYKLQLEDGTTWLVYAYHTNGRPLDLQVVNNGLAQSSEPFHGTIQVAKDPGNGEQIYDQACGAYSTGVELSGTVDGRRGMYTFSFKKAGMSGATLVMFALPHHQSSFDDATRGRMADVKLQTTTKGVATAVLADSWTMVESQLPTDIGFLPWSPSAGTVRTISDATKASIHNIARQEVSQDILKQTNLDSMYFSGKALAKFASIMLAINDLLGDRGLAQSGLQTLKAAFARFADNRQQFPLVYENVWGGVASSATYNTGNSGADFGNTLYNDHHFHFGYFIYTAAVIGHLDPSWLTPANRAYVNTLVRDIANPSPRDPYFPVWRSFDWFHGHSWAKGLFDSLDSKDQESSSEDTMHAYALKMWGAVSGDRNMEARAALTLAIQRRSLNAYYLYHSSNTVQPRNFIANKVAGILFENKIDHTTYFGGNIEYVQGIHMLPLLPHTPFVRTPEFVREEWDAFFSGGRAQSVTGGWKGILFGNYATIDPRAAYDFFSGRSGGWDDGWVDGGASRTWYLSYAAGEF